MFRLPTAARQIAIILFLASPVACATAKGYDRVCNTWLNSDANELMRSWGPPQKVQKMPNGNQLLLYKRSETYSGIHISILSRPLCETWFEVRPGGEIIDYKWRGNVCKAR